MWAGATQDRFQTGFLPDGGAALGPPQTLKQIRARQATVTLTNEHRFHRFLTLKSMASFYSLDWRRRTMQLGSGPFPLFVPTDPPEVRQELVDPNSPRYFSQRFREDEIYVRLIANLRLDDRYRAAIGVEYSHDWWGPGWGDSARDFRMGDSSNIVSGSGSRAFDFPKYGGVDPAKPCSSPDVLSGCWIQTDGFGASTLSGLGEADLRFHPLLGLLVSGRLDKNTRSNLLFTPRIAIVSRLRDRHALKLVWQRAQRMNTAEQLYVGRRVKGETAPPEVLTGYEAIFSSAPLTNARFTLSGFYNELNVIGWNANAAASQIVGNLHLAGTEIELAYDSPRWRVGANHSFVKQIKWRLHEGTTVSGISYSQYEQPTRDDPSVVIRSEGNDLNNWSNHASKLFAHVRVRRWLMLHLDGRIFWGFQGAKDGLRALEKGAVGSANAAVIQQAIDAVRAQDAYGVDLRVNASASVQLARSLRLTAYGMNLVGHGGFKRYAYDAGNVRASPVRTKFYQEPRTVGLTLQVAW